MDGDIPPHMAGALVLISTYAAAAADATSVAPAAAPMTSDDLISLASALIGYVIVVASVMLKVPQIISIVKSGHANGISLTTYLIDTFVFGVNASWGIAYGLPIATYFENAIILVQIVIVALLVGYHQRRMRLAGPAVAALCGLNALLALRLLPPIIHEVLFGGHIIVGIMAKFPQILLTHNRKATGALSFTTNFLRFGGGAVRFLTTMASVSWAQGKAVLLVSYGVSNLLNGAIVAQFFLYGHHDAFVAFRRFAARQLMGRRKGKDHVLVF